MTKTARRTALVVEPRHAIARQVQACLARADLQVLTPVQTLQDAFVSASAESPDVIVLNIDTPGDEATQRQLAEWATRLRTPIVGLSAAADRATMERAADRGAAACILTPFSDEQLIAAVRLLTIKAERSSAPTLTRRGSTAEEKLQAIAAVVNDVTLSGRRSGQWAVPPRDEQGDATLTGVELLSTREREIVDLLANGARVITIARQLQLSPHTVRNQLKSVFRKLNLHGQHELFDYWRGHRPR